MTEALDTAVGATAEEETPPSIHGGGWVFGRTEGGYLVHREEVDPTSADAGEVLYISAQELFGFVSCVDFSAEVYESDVCSSLAREMGPVDFVRSGNEKPVYSTFGAPPAPGTVVSLPGHTALRVDRVEVHYLARGQRRSVVVCE